MTDFPDLYKDSPRSIGAAVQRACVKRGLFSGLTVQRSDLLWTAQQEHKAANDGMTSPQQETLGRELRHRKRKTDATGAETLEGRQHFADRALLAGWRIVADDGRVRAERV